MSSKDQSGKVCQLKKAFYRPKQSPRGWFNIFSKATLKRRYKRRHVGHTLLLKRKGLFTVIITVYVNDIVVTGKDMVEVEKLKTHLRSKFEIKDSDELRHLLKLKLQNQKRNCDMVSEIYNRSVGRNKNV